MAWLSKLSSIVVVRTVTVTLASSCLTPRHIVVIGATYAVKSAWSWLTPRYVLRNGEEHIFSEYCTEKVVQTDNYIQYCKSKDHSFPSSF